MLYGNRNMMAYYMKLKLQKEELEGTQSSNPRHISVRDVRNGFFKFGSN